VRKKLVKLGLVVVGALGVVAAAAAVVGATTSVPVIEVKKETMAPGERVWELWADVPNRTRWDEGLEYARLDGPFREGETGEVKLKGQPARSFLITRCEPMEGYTDRFFLPLGGEMDWHHSMRKTDGGLEVAFKVEVSGPTALILAPVMKGILREELPSTVDELVALAERA
jgi:hypothetical protein